MPDPRRGGRPLSPESAHAWFDEYLDACNRHDLVAVRGFLGPDVRRPGRPSGADAWIADLDELLAGFPDFRWKRIAVVVEEDRVAAHLRTRATHRGPYRGTPATGRRISSAEFVFLRMAHGRIVESTVGADPGLLAQLTG